MLGDIQTQMCQRFSDMNATLMCTDRLYYNEVYSVYMPRSVLVGTYDTHATAMSVSYTTYSLCVDDNIPQTQSSTVAFNTQNIYLRLQDVVPFNVHEALQYIKSGDDAHIANMLSNRATIHKLSIVKAHYAIRQYYRAQGAKDMLTQDDVLVHVRAEDTDYVRLYITSDCKRYCARVELFDSDHVPRVSHCMHSEHARVTTFGYETYAQYSRAKAISAATSQVDTNGALYVLMMTIGIFVMSIAGTIISVSEHRYARAIRRGIRSVRKMIRRHIPRRYDRPHIELEERPRISVTFNRHTPTCASEQDAKKQGAV